ncbi:MAG TPA: GNAT family N-acetyltransferase [Chloroflexia bacterium]|nr:GNAT family N-acetyltransferase [Chloroflexia bacterium]
MQVRPVTLDEAEYYSSIDGDAFVSSPQETKDWLELHIKPNLKDTRALFNDQGEIQAILFLMHNRLWLGDGTVKVAGVAGVATPPEYRRQGGVKQLFKATLSELREAGTNVSALYPFYFPFYKRFGYEQVSTFKSVEVKIAALQKFKPKAKGTWKKVNSDRWKDFDAIYEKFSRGQFGRFVREEHWWQRPVFQVNEGRILKPYLWYDEQGVAQAYLIYSFKSEEDHGRTMIVRDQAWLTKEARYEILAFMANHDSQAVKVRWLAPASQEVQALLDDPREVEEKIVAGYMLRILDVPRALEERPWHPEAKGAFKLALRDSLLEWNNQAVQVEVEGGKASVQVLPEGSETGLACDIRQLAQMYAGYLSPVQLAELDLLEVRDERQLQAAQAAFYRPGQPASFMPDFF